MSTLAELQPDYLEDQRITLTPADLSTPVARRPLTLLVDASAALPQGLQLPIELLVTGPSNKSFMRKIDTRFVRSSFTFTPREGGRFRITMREVSHNRWWGSIDIDVQGNPFDPDPTPRSGIG